MAELLLVSKEKKRTVPRIFAFIVSFFLLPFEQFLGLAWGLGKVGRSFSLPFEQNTGGMLFCLLREKKNKTNFDLV